VWLQVSANGIITFHSNSSSFHLTPQPFPVFGSSYIAPLWFYNDVLQTNGNTGIVYYRQTSNFLLLMRAAREITTAFPNAVEFHPVSLLIITWNIIAEVCK